jgi:hypothetical protein
MNGLYSQTFHHLDKAFKKLEDMVPSPQKMPHGDAFVFRYREKTIHQALVQKLARVVSGLHSAQLLLENGFLQEQAAVQRMLDEFHEDILFLAHAVINGELTALHRDYLDAFYREEFDAPTALESSQNRPMVSRKKIRAYVAKVAMLGSDPSTGVTLSHTIHSMYSGFVHGASPHIMDMVEGSPPRFASMAWVERLGTKITGMTCTIRSSVPSLRLRLWPKHLATRNYSEVCKCIILSLISYQDETMPTVARVESPSFAEPRGRCRTSPHLQLGSCSESGENGPDQVAAVFTRFKCNDLLRRILG